MNTNEILIQQPVYYHAASSVPMRRGGYVWTPIAGLPGRYIVWDFARHDDSADGVLCVSMTRAALATVRSGVFHCDTGTGLSFPDGAWSNTSSENIGLRIWRANTTTNRMVLTVPAGTTRLYVLSVGRSAAAGGNSATVELAGGGTLLRGTINCNLDSGQATCPGDWQMSENGGTWPQRHMVKLAEGALGGSTITVTPGGTGIVDIVGFVAIRDNETYLTPERGTYPAGGVFDPEADSFITSIAGNLEDCGVLVLKYGSQAAKYWGQGHWSANDTLVNAPAALDLRYGGGATLWTPADNAWDEVVTDELAASVYGDVQFRDESAGVNRNVGTAAICHRFASFGLTRECRVTFNQTAEDNDLKIADGLVSGSGGYGGGYPNITAFGQYWTRIGTWPSADGYTVVPPYDDTNAVNNYDSLANLYGDQLVCQVVPLNGICKSSGRPASVQSTRCFYSRRVSGVSIPDLKMYRRAYSEGADYDVEAGDVLWGRTHISISPYFGQYPLAMAAKEAAEGVADINVDSTGGQLSLAKALEAVAARCVGNLTYDAATSVATFYGRDGATPVATVKLTGGGNRTESSIS